MNLSQTQGMSRRLCNADYRLITNKTRSSVRTELSFSATDKTATLVLTCERFCESARDHGDAGHTNHLNSIEGEPTKYKECISADFLLLPGNIAK